MDNNLQAIETLLANATEYGKTSLELMKLKTLDKTTNVIAAILPHTIVVFLLSCFFLFLNLGFAMWIGEILGKQYYGFFVVAIFYALIGACLHLFLYQWVKRKIGDYLIRQVFSD